MPWQDALGTLDVNGLHAVFPGDATRTDAGVILPTERVHRRRGRHTAIDARGAARAAEALDRPEPRRNGNGRTPSIRTLYQRAAEQ